MNTCIYIHKYKLQSVQPAGDCCYQHKIIQQIRNFCIICLQLLNNRLYVMYMYVFVIVYNPCISHPCQHGGECINATEGFVCKCKGNHNGRTCSGKFYTVPISVCYTFLRNPGARGYI